MSVQKMTLELFRFQRLILTLIAGQQFGSVVDVRVAFQIPPLVRGERATHTGRSGTFGQFQTAASDL